MGPSASAREGVGRRRERKRKKRGDGFFAFLERVDPTSDVVSVVTRRKFGGRRESDSYGYVFCLNWVRPRDKLTPSLGIGNLGFL